MDFLGKLQSNVFCVVKQKNVLFQQSFVRHMWGGCDDKYKLLTIDTTCTNV